METSERIVLTDEQIKNRLDAMLGNVRYYCAEVKDGAAKIGDVVKAEDKFEEELTRLYYWGVFSTAIYWEFISKARELERATTKEYNLQER